MRSAIETLAPKADLICVVSAVSRETISPVRAVSKKRRIEPGEMREHGGAQIGDDALAERHHEVVAQRARQREDGHDDDQHAEIGVDQLAAPSAEKP